jgi:HD-GYP domain-containing protein (c-di-GMP phosphodiesterase class II)
MHQMLAEHPQMTEALNRALGVYDRRTAQHAARVRTLALSLGDWLGVGGDEREALGWAALLHDLGKISVSRAILRKTGPLTDHEWIEMKRHPIVGSDMLLAISPLLQPIAAGVRGHHEQWDGAGYPDGLVGEQTPRVARIIAVADAFDAMTCTRPYRRRPFGRVEAAATIQSGAGSQFDPRVVAAFAALRQVTVGPDAADDEGRSEGDDAWLTEEPPTPPRTAAPKRGTRGPRPGYTVEGPGPRTGTGHDPAEFAIDNRCR